MQATVTHGNRGALLSTTPNPARDYDEALTRFAVMQAQDGPEVNPVCRSTLLTHDERTEQAIVLVHGITNCPRQFIELAPLFFERGYNVLVPRMPWNGFADQSGVAMEHLTAEELRAFGDEIVDIARGLGERVTVLGLSGGGVVTAWIAQARGDVEKAVVIAPSIGIVANVPLGDTGANATNRLATWLMGVLPNLMTQTFRPMKGGPPHNYQGFATRGLGQTTELGLAVYGAAKTQPPAARTIAMITNDRDIAVIDPPHGKSRAIPGLLTADQTCQKDAVTGLHEHWRLDCHHRSTGVDFRRPCGIGAVYHTARMLRHSSPGLPSGDEWRRSITRWRALWRAAGRHRRLAA